MRILLIIILYSVSYCSLVVSMELTPALTFQAQFGLEEADLVRQRERVTIVQDDKSFDIDKFLRSFGAATKDISSYLFDAWVKSPMRNTVDNSTDTVIKAIFTVIEQELNREGTAIHSFYEFLSSSEPKDNVIKHYIATFFATLAEQMEDPKSQQKMQDIKGKDKEAQIKIQGNEIRRALEAFLKMMADQFNEGGFDLISKNMIAMWRRYMQKEGPLAKMLDDITKLIDEQMKKIDATIAQSAQRIEELSINVEGSAKRVVDQFQRAASSTVKAAFLGTGGIGIAWFGSRLLMKRIENYFGLPRLVSESSRKNILQQLHDYFWPQPLVLREMIFAKDLKKELDDIVTITKSVSKQVQEGKTNVKYLNVLLWGPPGTGKTLFAEELAKKSGLDFAIMSGASFSKFSEREGIEAMDELFSWAKKSTKGLIIFIDEAESFLSHRTPSNESKKEGNSANSQSKEYKLITNFLHKTGEASNKFMLIFATNKPEMLSSAVGRRIHRRIKVGLPDKPERIKILRLYRDQILLDKDQNTPEYIESVKIHLKDAMLDSIADKTQGLAASELQDIINDIKASEAVQPLISKDLVDDIVSKAMKKQAEFNSSST